MSVRIGIDLVDVGDVRESIRVHGERYLRRIYTEQERRDSGDEPRGLAARFAAKEAAMKALGYGDEQIDWLSIVIGQDLNRRTSLNLTGRAADLAERRGIRSASLSLTHARSQALAVVIMEAGEECRGR